MTFGLPPQAHAASPYYYQNKRHSDPPITNSGDINQVGIIDSSVRSDQYRRPRYDYHTSMEELNNDIQDFMTRGGFMEGGCQPQQQNSPNEITPTDIALRRASIEMSAGDVLDLMEALSD